VKDGEVLVESALLASLHIRLQPHTRALFLGGGDASTAHAFYFPSKAVQRTFEHEVRRVGESWGRYSSRYSLPTLRSYYLCACDRNQCVLVGI